MKLAPVTLSIVHVGTGGHAGAHRGRSNATILLRSNFVRPLRIRRRSGRPCRPLACFPADRSALSAVGRSTANPQTTIYGPGPHRTKRRCHWQARRSPRRQLRSRVSQTCQQTYVIPI